MARSSGASGKGGGYTQPPTISNSAAYRTAVPTGDAAQDTTWEPKSPSKPGKPQTTEPPKGRSKYQSEGNVSERYSDSQPTGDKGTVKEPAQYDEPHPVKWKGKGKAES